VAENQHYERSVMECPWVELRKVCHLFGLTYEAAKNRIYAETFPVPVRKEGRRLVIDKAVIERYFTDRRDADLARLDSTKG